MLDQATLKEWVHYDPETGVFTRLKVNTVRWQCLVGQPVTNRRHGYIRVYIGRREYPAHRLAWLYMTGAWPKVQLDHINRVKTDNRWSNLREATIVQNAGNVPPQHRKTHGRMGKQSGVRGVYWRGGSPVDTKWVAHLDNKHLGAFDTIDEAKAAYEAAAKAKWGEFAHVWDLRESVQS
jgi:hypothetical protein